MAKAKKDVVLSGANIYYDKHNRAVYYNKRSKVGHVIPKEMEPKMQPLLYRYILGIVCFILCELLFKINIWVSLGLSAVIIAVLEYRFRTLVSSFPRLKNFEPEASKKAREELAELSNGGLILRMCLYFALGILLIANLFATEGILGNTALVIASIVVALAAAYMGVRIAITYFKNRK